MNQSASQPSPPASPPAPPPPPACRRARPPPAARRPPRPRPRLCRAGRTATGGWPVPSPPPRSAATARSAPSSTASSSSKPPRSRVFFHVLEIAATQILFMEVADHAAVSIAIDQIAADPKARHLKGLANAVLRRLARERDALLAALDPARLDTPDWLWQRWVAGLWRRDRPRHRRGPSASSRRSTSRSRAMPPAGRRSSAAVSPPPAPCASPMPARSRRCPAMPTAPGGCRTWPPRPARPPARRRRRQARRRSLRRARRQDRRSSPPPAPRSPPSTSPPTG